MSGMKELHAGAAEKRPLVNLMEVIQMQKVKTTKHLWLHVPVPTGSFLPSPHLNSNRLLSPVYFYKSHSTLDIIHRIKQGLA